MLTELESRFARVLQSKSGKLPLAILDIALLFVSSAPLHSSQEPRGARPPIPFPSDSAPMGPVSREAISDNFERDIRSMEARSRLDQMQDTRHKLQSDTGKLLSLAADLQAEIDKQGGNSLTTAETKKLAQIQKLAQRVKSKLGDYARGY